MAQERAGRVCHRFDHHGRRRRPVPRNHRHAGDGLANKIAAEQVIFTQTDAPAAATEANAIDAADDDYSVSVVDHLGDDANDTAKADSTWDIALANAASAYLLANAQADKDAQIAYAQVPLGGSGTAASATYVQETADAQLALTKSQADADLAWVKSKATADSGFLSDDASSWDGMVHTESQAVDTFAHTDDLAAKTENDSIGADEAGTLVPQAEADETQESGDATAAGDFSTDEDQQAATEWQTLANQLGTPWAEEQAGEASAEASWASTEASNYEGYVTKLGTAETAYATSDAGQFTDEVTKIDAADQTDGDAAADADQTLTNTLADDETEVEQAAAGADSTYWVAVAQANHDFRVAGAQASHDVLVGGSSAGYNTAMTAAANTQSLALNGAIAQFHATVDPVTAITGQTDIDATLTHDTSIADLSLDDFTKTEQAQNAYSDLESGDYDTQQKADNLAEHDLTVADANAEASAMAAFAQANPSPWADEAAAEAQAKATQTIAAADAELTMDNQAADGQASQEIAQADAAAARDIAYAKQMHDQTVATAQKVHDLSTPTGVSVPDAITPPIDGTPPTLTADYAGGFEAGNLWLPDTTEDFLSLPLAVPSTGEMEEPDAPGLVTDMILGAMVVNGRRPYTTMLYGTIDLSAPLPFAVPGYYFFDNVSHDATPLYGDGNPNQSLPPGSAQAIASTNWSNGTPTVTSTATQPGPSGPTFFGQQASGGGSGSGGSGSGGGGTKAPQQAQGPSSSEPSPAVANPGGPELTDKASEKKDTARQDGDAQMADAAADPAPTHEGKTIVVEFLGHKFKNIDDGADGIGALNTEIDKAAAARAVKEARVAAGRGKKIDKPAIEADAKSRVDEETVDFTGLTREGGALDDVEGYIDLSLRGHLANINPGDTVRVIIVGYSHGAENAINAVERFAEEIGKKSATAEIHLILIDAINPGPEVNGKRLGRAAYTSVPANVRALAETILNYFQQKDPEPAAGDEGVSVRGSELKDPVTGESQQDNTDGNIGKIVQKRMEDSGSTGFVHGWIDNVLGGAAKILRDLPPGRGRVSLAEIIARWELMGF